MMCIGEQEIMNHLPTIIKIKHYGHHHTLYIALDSIRFHGCLMKYIFD